MRLLPRFCRNTLTDDTSVVPCPPCAVAAVMPIPTLPHVTSVDPATLMQFAGAVRNKGLSFWNAITDPDKDALVHEWIKARL
jgi:hypothetical protein